jgi:hypothetical protein
VMGRSVLHSELISFRLLVLKNLSHFPLFFSQILFRLKGIIILRGSKVSINSPIWQAKLTDTMKPHLYSVLYQWDAC